MAVKNKDQLALGLNGRETFDQAMRAAFNNCIALKKKSYDEVMREPHLRRCIEIMAEIRLKQAEGACG